MSSFLTIPEKKMKESNFQFDWEKWNKAIFQVWKNETIWISQNERNWNKAISTAWIEIETKEISQIAGKLKQLKFSQLQENWNKGNFHNCREHENKEIFTISGELKQGKFSQLQGKFEMDEISI